MRQTLDPRTFGRVMKVMVVEEIDYFDSFCTRMWLDYCDENNDPISAPDRMDKDEYVEKYHDWLKEKFNKKYENI